MIQLAAIWAVVKKIDWRIIAVIIVALVAAIGLHHWASSLKEQGRIEVRQQWAQAQRKADLLHIAQVEAQQKKINATDADLVATRANLDAARNELRAALTEDRENNASQSGEKPSAALACRPMPDRVRNALNALGRGKR
ncbi:hypothetical protein FB480_101826 [Agrobacterium vitis]|nr:hypothetical protein FB480_101826 [Agrobacterium vitis]